MSKIRLLLMLLLVTVFSAKAQNTPQTLTVNDGTITNNYVPIYSSWADAYQRCQYIMPAEDLTAMEGMSINGMTLYYDSNSPTLSYGDAEFEIYMKQYGSETFGTSTLFVDLTNATLVYSGSITGEDGEISIDFNTPFDYWESNLLIEFRITTPGSMASAQFIGADKRNASLSNYNSYSVDMTYGTQRNFLPKTTFSYYQETEVYEVFVDAIPSVGGLVSGAGEYRVGRSCTLNAEPATGYSFTNYSTMVGPEPIVLSYDPTYSFNVMQNMAIIANFTINTYNITAVTYSDEGTVYGSGDFEYGDNCTLTAVVNEGSEYHFLNWRKDNTVVSEDAVYEFTVNETATYVAYFAINEYTITASVNDEDAGYVIGAGTYPYEEEIELTAISNFGYEFVNWSTPEEEEYSTDATIQITVEEDAEYIANFRALTVEDDDITVCEFNGYGYYAYPTYVAQYDAYTRSQYVIPSTELNELVGHPITGLKYSFFVDSAEPMEDDWTTDVPVEVYLFERSSMYLYSFVDKEFATTVYEGTLTFGTNCELAITFDTPYIYNGDNLLVGIDNLLPGSTLPVMFFGRGVDYTRAICGYDYDGPEYIYELGYESFIPTTTITYAKVVPDEVELTVTPDEIDMGTRANNAWSQNNYTYNVNIYNSGKSATITSIATTNPYFEVDLGNIELPYVLKNDKDINILVEAVGVAEGELQENLVITYDNDETEEVALTIVAYTPVAGDVWETAIDVVFDDNGTYTNDLPVDDLHDNYSLFYNYWGEVDAVYKVTFDHEVSLSAGTTGNNGQTYIYSEDFGQVGGPTWYNTYLYNGPTIVTTRDNNDYIIESFDGETENLPDGWWSENYTCPWKVNTDNHYAYCEHNVTYGLNPQGESRLVAPFYNMSNETDVVLTFKYMNKRWDNDVDYFGVYWRNYNNGQWSEWTELYYTDEAHETWETVEMTLTPDDVEFGLYFQISFVMTDNFGHGVQLDEVTLIGYREPDYQIENDYIPAGTYYIVVSSTDTDFQQVDMQLGEVPAPMQSTVDSPYEDETVALDASVVPSYGWYTEETQILYGITNPPTDTLVNWTNQLYAEYPFENLEYNKKYYVQVNSRNLGGETAGEVRSFTTVREGATNFAADLHQVYYGANDTITFTWDAVEDALGYSLCYGYYYPEQGWTYWYGNSIGNIITDTEYKLPVNDWLAATHTYGYVYKFAVKTVYKYGYSDYSNVDYVDVSKTADYVIGMVFEQDVLTTIGGATVTITCVDEFDVEHVYNLTTDDASYFEYVTDNDEENFLYVGDYTLTVAKDGYQSVDEVFSLDYYDNTGHYNEYILKETYYPVTNVVATIIDGDTKAEVVPEVAHITWEYESLDRSLQGFNIYRTSAYNNGPYTVENTEVIALGVEETEYDDDTWAALAEQGEGTYKYGVAAVYAGNAPQQTRDIVYVIQEDFENGLPEGWTTIDADGDGYDWFLGSTYPNYSNIFTNNGHNGSYDMMVSSSYDNNISSALHPDNYLVTPQVKLQGTFGFYATCYSTSWGAEHFGIALSTDGVNFTTIDEWTLGSKGGATGGPRDRGDRAQGAWGYYSINLDETSFAGQTGYIAIRHFDCTDQYYLEIDDVELYYEYTPLFVDGMSEIEWSNPLDINMEIENGVAIDVDLNNGGKAEGALVVLTNLGNGEEISAVLDENGHYEWATFKKGDYSIEISLEDYITLTSEVSIWNETLMSYTMNYAVPMTITTVANPEGYGRAEVYWDNELSWGTEHDYLYGDLGNVWAGPEDDKEFVFWSCSDTMVTTNHDYYFEVVAPGDYVANFRTPGTHYVVEEPTQFGNTMTMIGVIQIEGEIQNDLELEVGAFVGDECRGGARLEYYKQIEAYRVFLTVYGEEDGDLVEFYLYNHGLGEEYDLRCATKETFESDAIFGTASEPYVFNFRNTVLQTVELAEGWNWMSTYIEQNNFEGLAVLEEGLGTNGVSIVSQSNGFVTYDEEYDEWSGNLTALNNEEMFKVNVSGEVEFEMEGYQADPANHEITLYNGWTYLGFISMEPMSIEEAFVGMEPTDGDMIKAQEGFATYDAEYEEWSGSLNTLMPGLGFMYKSNNEDEVTFTYPVVNRGTTEANITSEHWTANMHAYPTNMTVVAVVELNNSELVEGNYELATFANDECRGSVKLINAGSSNRYYAFLTVAGKDAAELNFALYNAETGIETFDSEAHLSFSSDAMIGSMNEPMVISFKGTTGIDELNGDLMLYPNPTEKGGYVRMVMSNETTRADVEIINSLGQVVSAQTTTQMPANIQVPDEAGIYTVKIITEGKNVKCHKLIVK